MKKERRYNYTSFVAEEKYGVRNVKIRLKDRTYVEDDEYLRALEVDTCLSIVDENEIPPVQRVHVAEMNEVRKSFSEFFVDDILILSKVFSEISRSIHEFP